MSSTAMGHTTRRNHVATLLLPGLVLMSAYLLLQRPKLVSAKERERENLEDARRDAPSAEAVRTATERVFALRDQVDAERERQRVAAAEAATVAAALAIEKNQPAKIDRPVWRREFSGLMERHGIVVISDRAAEVTVTSGGAATAGGARTRVRELELRGDYTNVLDALEEFGRSKQGGNVLDLAMKRIASEGNVPAWTLTIG